MIGPSGTRNLSADWARLLEEHARALQEYCAAASALERAIWMAPVAPGKWSPAEITAHVAEAYRVLSAELGGADGMRLRGSRLQRLVLRYTVLPRLLTGKPFPPGARAPREICPTEIIEDPALAVATLLNLAEQFTRDVTERAATPGVRLTHAYFGRLSPRQGLELSTAHTRHHARQLTAISPSP
ncbi:MAG TPA: DinB family protein [Gemmatimonadales bacterium]|nr:DinB family protein [Gemmatimonadales bacterium]